MPHAAPSLTSALVYQHMGPTELAALERLFDVSTLPASLRVPVIHHPPPS